MKYVLGLDGGATKTEVIVTNENFERIGIGYAGPSNYQTSGLKRSLRNIRKAVEEACRMVGTEPPVDVACLALAGINSRLDYELLIGEISKLHLCSKLILVHDGEAALHAVAKGKKAIIVIIGTGSLVAGYDDQGRYHRACNWGHIIGDEGSAYAIAVRTLSRIMKGFDGRAKRLKIEDEILKALKLRDASEIATVLYTKLGNEDIAALAPIILKSTEEEIMEILKEQARAIAECVKAIYERTGSKDVYLVGGLTRNELYVDLIKREINSLIQDVRVRIANIRPSVGALLIALKEEGIKPKLNKIAKVFYKL